MNRTKDYNGNKLKTYIEFERCKQLTVGELKNKLSEYSNDTKIFIEAYNAYNQNDTMWSQIALDTYPCKEHELNKKALMIVGDLK